MKYTSRTSLRLHRPQTPAPLLANLPPHTFPISAMATPLARRSRKTALLGSLPLQGLSHSKPTPSANPVGLTFDPQLKSQNLSSPCRVLISTPSSHAALPVTQRQELPPDCFLLTPPILHPAVRGIFFQTQDRSRHTLAQDHPQTPHLTHRSSPPPLALSSFLPLTWALCFLRHATHATGSPQGLCTCSSPCLE